MIGDFLQFFLKVSSISSPSSSRAGSRTIGKALIPTKSGRLVARFV